MRVLIPVVVLCMTLPTFGNVRVSAQASAKPTAAEVAAETKAKAEFMKRVEAYAALHRKIEGALPKLSTEATPDEIDKSQRAFLAQMAAARQNARVGDIFVPEMQVVARRLMERLFTNPQARRQLRDSVMDENPPPAQIKLAVNARYPDDVPLSTMPPDILKELPTLPEELEYRFVGETLILLDPHPHIVVDYVTRALPR